MFVRATTIHADLAKLDEGVAFVRDSVVPAVASLPGTLGLTMMVDRQTGTTSVSTAWETEQARADADEVLTSLRAKASRLMGGGTPVTELFELVAMDRLRPAQAGFWSRVTRVTIPPADVDDAIDAYTSSIVHDLRLLDGYCSAVLLVDRAKGVGAVIVTFDSRKHVEATRDQAAAIRRTGLEKAGAEIGEVREAEIVIAGLRLPQTG
jgi:hypothetical protein